MALAGLACSGEEPIDAGARLRAASEHPPTNEPLATGDALETRRAAPSLQAALAARIPGLPNILLITLDTTRADHIGCYGYFRDTSPNIDELASESILFERCIAPMATTLPVHTSLFTGVWPLEHGTLANVKQERERYAGSPSLDRATELFQRAGYQTAAFVSALPLRKKFGLLSGFDLYDAPRQPARAAAETTDRVLSWLEQEQRAPYFLWVHYFDPHSPYEAPEPQASRYHDDAALEAYIKERGFSERAQRPTGQENVLREGINSYDGELRYMDEQLGRLLAALHEREDWTDTVVLLLGDHGEGLNQHMAPGHGMDWDEQLHVPCLLRLPGVGGHRLERLISVVDLFPTLFGHLEIPHSSAFLRQSSGVDVLDASFVSRPILSQSSERQDLFGAEPTYSLTTPRWKSIVTESGQTRLFDLLADPHELVDRSREFPEVLSEMQEHSLQLVRAMRERGEQLGAGKVVPLDPEEASGLRSLGYMGETEDD